MGLIQKAGGYGSKYKGHHLKSGVKVSGRRLSDGRLKEHRLSEGRKLKDGALNADY